MQVSRTGHASTERPQLGGLVAVGGAAAKLPIQKSEVLVHKLLLKSNTSAVTQDGNLIIL